PGVVGDPVAALVLLGAAHREQDAAVAPAVDELAADAGRDARALVRLQLALAVLEPEGQCARQDHVHLLLPFVGVDAPPLAGCETDEVQAERLDAELGAQALEAIASGVVEG